MPELISQGLIFDEEKQNTTSFIHKMHPFPQLLIMGSCALYKLSNTDIKRLNHLPIIYLQQLLLFRSFGYFGIFSIVSVCTMYHYYFIAIGVEGLMFCLEQYIY